MEECAGFKVLPVKANADSKAIRQLFMKMHVTREKCPEKPEYQTLFVVGVPEFCDQKILKHAFSRCGQVKSVFLYKEPTPFEPEALSKYIFPRPAIGFKVAYIVFAHTSGLEKALSMQCTESEPFILSTKAAPIQNVVSRWCQNYNECVVDTKELHSRIESYLKNYDAKVAAKSKAEKEAANNEDEDGWKTVTKKGRNPGFARKEALRDHILKSESKKKAKKTLKNFYQFQIKETKVKQLMELRKKYENDKSKIDLLKQSRKFKPF